MKKQLTAFVAAIFITMCIATGIFVVSGVAYANTNGTQAANTPSQSASTTGGQGVSTDVNASNVVGQVQIQQQIQQLQSLVAQYQQREQQYQAQVTQANTQLAAAQQQLQQYQSLVNFLQQRGIITITSGGQVYVNR